MLPATSIYGARALNGVIVVTTRSHACGNSKNRVSYSSEFTLREVPSYSQFDLLQLARDNEHIPRAGTEGLLFTLSDALWQAWWYLPPNVQSDEYAGPYYWQTPFAKYS